MNDYQLGLELSGSQLKIATFQKKGRGYQLISLDSTKTDNIKNWIVNNCPHARSIDGFLAVPESLIYLKKLSLPAASSQQLRNAIHWELHSQTNIPMDLAVYDYKILHQDKQKVQAVAMLLKQVESEELFDTFRQAGVNLRSIEPSSLALARTISINPDQNTLLLSVAKEETNLLVLEKGYPTFTTSVALDLESNQANRRRLSETTIANLAANTHKTIEYWQQKQHQPIHQVVLTGDISLKYYGLATAIYNLAQIPTFYAKPNSLRLQTKNINKTQITRYYVAIGAALRAKRTAKSLNFLPPAQIEAMAQSRREKLWIRAFSLTLSVGLLLLAAAGTAYGYGWLQSRSLERQIQQTRQFTANHPAQAYLEEARQINQAVEAADKLIRSQKNLGPRLEAIQALQPPQTELTGITFSQLDTEDFTLEGTGDRTGILTYYQALEASSGAKLVTMPYSNLAQPRDNKFEITIKW